MHVGGQWEHMGGSIRAQTGQTTDEINSVKMAIRDTALETGRFTASEMITGLYGVSRAGQSVEHQMGMLEQSMRLADASGKYFGASISTLDALMVKFNTDIQDASKWVNILAVAQQEMTISQISMLDGLQRSAGIANAAGLSYDFLAAALGFAYQGGQSMQTAATGLTGIFNQMLDPTSNIRDAMNELGVATILNSDGTINAQDSMIKFMRELENSSPLMQEQIANTMSLSGSNLDLFTNIMDNIGALDEQSEMFKYAMEAGDDYARVLEMIEGRTGNFGDSLRRIQTAGTDMLKTIFDIIAAPIGDALGNAADKAVEFAKRMREGGDLHPYVIRLGEAIASLVRGVMSMVEVITPLALRILPTMASVVANVVENIVRFRYVILGMVAAFKMWQLGNYIQNLKMFKSVTMDSVKALFAKKTAMQQNAMATKSAAAIEKIRANATALTTKADLYSTKAAKASALADNLATKATTARAAATKASTVADLSGAAAAGKLSIGMGAVAISKKAAAAGAVILKKALIATGIGALVVGVGALAVGLVTLVNRLRSTSEETDALAQENDRLISSMDNLTNSIDNNNRAHNERINITRDESDAMLELSGRLDDLMQIENKTTEQRQETLQIIRQMNSLMPELNLYINEETGLLNQTTEAIHNQIEARRESMLLQAKMEREIELALDIAAANRELIAVQEAQIVAVEALTDANRRADRIRLQAEVDRLNEAERALTVTIQNSQREHYALRSEIYLSTATTQEAAAAAEAYSAELLHLKNQISETAQEAKRYSYTIEDVIRSTERLTRAKEEQNSEGQLSLKTINDLIENGYALALQINAETGAVELNTDAYIEMTKARIDEKIAALQTDREALINNLNAEANTARQTAGAYIDLAKARTAERASIEDNIHGMDMQIAALQQLRNGIGQTTESTNRSTGAAQRSAGAQREAGSATRDREEAERDLYNQQRRIYSAHVDALRQIEAAENRFAEAVQGRTDAILNSALRLSELNRLMVDSTESRADAVIAAEERVNNAEIRLSELRQAEFDNEADRRQALTQAMEELANHQETLAEARYKAEKTNAQLIIQSMEETIENMQEHARMLDYILAETDITKDFLTEMQLLELGAVHELATLYNSSKEELSKIADLFGEMQALAADRAIEEMQGLRYEVNYEIQGIYDSLNDLIASESVETGENMVYGMIEGVKAKTTALSIQLTDTVNASTVATRQALQMSSPSRVYVNIGENTIDGFIRGVGNRKPQAIRTMENFARAMGDTMRRGLDREDFPRMGENISLSISMGIESQMSVPLAAAENLARAIATAIAAAFAMGSPSRLFIHYGEMLSTGLAIGIENTSHKAVSALKDMYSKMQYEPAFAPIPAIRHFATMPVYAQRHSDTPHGGIEQIIHVHGNVTENQFGYQAYRGAQKALMAGGIA